MTDYLRDIGATAALPQQAALSAARAQADPITAPSAAKSAAMTSAMTVTRIDTVAAFEGLADDWAALLASARGRTTAFLRHGFLATWARHFCHETEAPPWRLRVITVRDAADRLVLAWPLAIEPGAVTTLRWMGEPIAQYGDALIAGDIDAEPAIDAAWREIEDLLGVDVIALGRIREDAAIAPFISRYLGPQGAPLEAPYVDLSDIRSEADYLDRMKSKSRREVRRKTKKLDGLGAITADFETASLAAQSVTAKALGFKRLWLDDLGLTSRVFSDPRALRVITALAGEDADSGFMAMALRVDGHPAAIELGLRQDGHYMAYLGCFNPAYAPHSPGTVQMARMIDWAARNGVTTYDLMPPADGYKLRWACCTVGVQGYGAALSLKGHAYLLYANRLRPWLKARFEALPVTWRRRLSRHLRTGG